MRSKGTPFFAFGCGVAVGFIVNDATEGRPIVSTPTWLDVAVYAVIIAFFVHAAYQLYRLRKLAEKSKEGDEE